MMNPLTRSIPVIPRGGALLALGNLLLTGCSRDEGAAGEVLTERIPSLHLMPGQDLRWSPNMTFRGPQALPIDWSA
jgi:hypothetical protein